MASDEVLLVELVDDWVAREHPGDRRAADAAVSAALTALTGGASIFEALAVGRGAVRRPGSPRS